MKYYSKNSLKKIAYGLRPRERLINKGAENVEDKELLAILLGTGRKGSNVVSVAQEVLNQYPLQTLRSCSIKELCSISGVHLAKATAISAALELGRRAWAKESEFPPVIESPADVLAYVYSLGEAKKEMVVAIYLNVRNRVIHHETISVGILDASLIHPREVFEPAIRHSCAAIIVIHNHPSGDTTPSPEDISLTRQLIKAGSILGIPLMDHLIIGKREYISIRDLNVVEFAPIHDEMIA